MSAFKNKDWEFESVHLLAGESQVSHGGVFTQDERFLLAACGCIVKVYSVETGRLVRELQSEHKDLITHLELGNLRANKVFASYADGHIVVWDYSDGGLLKSLHFDCPIVYFGSRYGNNPALLVVTHDEQKLNYSIICLNGCSINDMKHNSSVKCFNDDILPLFTVDDGSIKKIAFTFDYSNLVTFHDKILYVYDINNDQLFKYVNSFSITCCACHPRKHCIATGDANGRIMLWYNYGEGEGSVVTTTKLHWHAHAVSDVCFSSDGTYLLSGGEEGVLVQWQLETGGRHFRPRLGAPVVGVACCPGDRVFAVSLANNVIQLVSGLHNEVTHSLLSLYRSLPGMGYEERLSTGLVYDPRSMSLVLNGLPGHLQFVDINTLTLKSELEVVSLNYVSRSDDKSIVPTIISHVSFSPSGEWMATVDSWEPTELTHPEIKLKFWRFCAESQRYNLKTIVDPPHQQTVTSLKFRPSTRLQNRNESSSRNENEFNDRHTQLMLATTGMDGKFKLWVQDGREQGDSWLCDSAGHYYSFPCSGCGFSGDGSILAVNFGKYVTLWDPVLMSLLQVLSSSIPNDVFREVCFCHSDSSHYLMMTSKRHFHMWNLLTYNIELVLPLTVDVMVTDPYSNVAAIFTSNVTTSKTSVKLMIVSPLSSKPLATYKDFSSHSVQAALFLPVIRDGKVVSSTLYFMDTKQHLYTVSDEEPIDITDFKGSVSASDVQRNRRWFNEIFGSNRSVSMATKFPVFVKPKENKILLGSPLSLPPMSACCKSFLSSLLPNHKTTPIDPPDVELMNMDNDDDHKEVESEEEEEDAKPHPHQRDDTELERKEKEEVDNRKLDVLIGKFEWLTDFFRAELNSA